MTSLLSTQLAAAGTRLARRALPWVCAFCFWLETSPLAWAKGKKAEEVVETKSWVVPYMIVLAFVGLGLMTVLRPSTRAEKPPETAKQDDD
jgi:hypothetical protein